MQLGSVTLIVLDEGSSARIWAIVGTLVTPVSVKTGWVRSVMAAARRARSGFVMPLTVKLNWFTPLNLSVWSVKFSLNRS